MARVFAYQCGQYRVPVMQGVRVMYEGRPGVVTSAGSHVRIRLDGETFSDFYHPKTDSLVYLPTLPQLEACNQARRAFWQERYPQHEYPGDIEMVNADE